jgi:hypothetical protein
VRREQQSNNGTVAVEAAASHTRDDQKHPSVLGPIGSDGYDSCARWEQNHAPVCAAARFSTARHGSQYYCWFFVSTRGPSAVGILTQQQQQAGYGKRLGSRQNPSVEDNDDNDDDYYYTHRAGAHSLRLSSTGETCQAFPSRHWMSASSGAAWGSDEETSF